MDSTDRKRKTSGIYAIYSACNGRRYVGSAVDIRRRWRRHRSDLRNGKHKNIHLQRAWDKHGEEAFDFVVLEECSVEQLIEREQHYMDMYLDKYNCAPLAGSSLGRKASPEARANMSAAQTGRKHTPEAKAKMSASQKARGVRTLTPEHRANIGAAGKGRVATDEARANMSKAQMGNTNGAGAWLGRTHTDEAKSKMSDAAKVREVRKREERERDA